MISDLDLKSKHSQLLEWNSILKVNNHNQHK